MRYHLIGIGGAGMSAIAHVLLSQGHAVSGSDRQDSDAVRRLRSMGATVAIGHAASNVAGADAVVYTPAVGNDNPELVEARRMGISVIERPEMLGRLIEPYKHRVAVSGTHGKTTTTAMIDAVLQRAGLNPTSLIGGDVSCLGGNTRIGGGSVVLTEACEAFASFLHLHPSIAVITNIEADHLDFYGTVERVEAAFRQFMSQIDEDGCVIACWDDAGARRIVPESGRSVLFYGLGDSPDLRATSVNINIPEPEYELQMRDESLGHIKLGVPGIHNVLNSLGAAAVGIKLGASVEAIGDALRDFRGAGRRFEILFKDDRVMVVDDYAHHPSEIQATLSATRAAYNRRIVAVFQPHLYSRTQTFCSEFADALSLADEVILAPIYPAREEPIEGVSAENIVQKMRNNGFTNVRYATDKASIPSEIMADMQNDDMILIMGAGDIRTVSEALAAMLSEGANR